MFCPNGVKEIEELVHVGDVDGLPILEEWDFVREGFKLINRIA